MGNENCNYRIHNQIPIPSRRQFVSAALATVAGSSLLAEDAIAPKPPRPVTFGFNTYGFRTLKTEEVIRELAKIGFDTVQFDASAGLDADPVTVGADRRAEFRRVVRDCGIQITALQGVGRPTVSDTQHAKDLERFKVMMQYAHDLNPDHPPLIEAGLGGRDPFAKMKPLFEKRVADWVKLAEANAITIVVKPHRDTSMDRPEQAVELFKDLGSSPRLRMSYDFSHFALRDMTLEETIRIALPWTGFVALKDVALDEKGHTLFKLPGETGKIDYTALVRQFYLGGYSGDFNCEVSSMICRAPNYDMIAAAKFSYEKIAPAFVAAGVPRVKRK